MSSECPPSPAVSFVRLSQATGAQIRAAVDAVADVLVDGARSNCSRWLSRAEAALEGTFPDAVALLFIDGRAVGWAGWVPYPDDVGAWQSTTYFSRAHRGTGLLDRARCWQIHAMATVEQWSGARDGVVFLSSIAVENHRSLAASRRYADRHGWPQAWETRHERVEGRDALVLHWPANAPHACAQTR